MEVVDIQEAVKKHVVFVQLWDRQVQILGSRFKKKRRVQLTADQQNYT